MPLAPYFYTLAGVWILGIVAAITYARLRSIPDVLLWVLLPAFLIEIAFYLAAGFPAVRERIRGPVVIPVLLASAVIPFLVAIVPLGAFDVAKLLLLLALAGTAVCWYRVLPARPLPDLLFLGLMGGVFLSPAFDYIYFNPADKPALDILGRMMWVRLGIAAIQIIRKRDKVEFSFMPTGKEWLTGARYYAIALAVTVPLALLTGFVQRPIAEWDQRVIISAIGTFLGMLWVVALGEEFFFRGLLQVWVERWTGSAMAGLIAASLLFGAVHLGFRGFPNIRFAMLAALSGVIYGLAYRAGGSIRASMVTHALLATTWRVFFV